MKLDLHVHTTYSDGVLTPRQVVEQAKQCGLSAVAITDHDECRGYGDVADERDIKVIAGIELSAAFHGEVHVLGLDVDWQNTALLAHVNSQSQSRRKRAEAMVEKFRDNGIEMTMQDVLDACKGDVLGRPHFAEVLIKKGHVNSTKQAFAQYLNQNAKCFVARGKVDIREAAQLINDAGGKTVLAHPGLISGTVWNELSGRLTEFGFWGIEAYHPAHTNGQCRELLSFAKSGGLFVTSGSDFHGYAKTAVEIGQERRGGKYLARSMSALGVTAR
ncbi:MAG: PHP domain-containing protein [Clostridia bacterium]|jgi:3',5'-nucleoside bisphosphate phosphatase|nr:PHP domain-containing protein [Clostridia bacterium]MBT7121911.1 PHP domain-containing protein [Clostridia bacterium]